MSLTEQNAPPPAVSDVRPCPLCGTPTRSLKQYRYFHRLYFVLFGAAYRPSCLRACPPCMRRYIAGRITTNVVSGNLLWLVLMVPWGLVLVMRSYLPGHSQGVLAEVPPEGVVLQELAAGDVSWGRVWAVVGLLAAAAPVLGPLIALIARLATRRADGWTRQAGLWALRLSLVAQLVWAAVAVWVLP